MTAREWSWHHFRTITGRQSSVVTSGHNSPGTSLQCICTQVPFSNAQIRVTIPACDHISKWNDGCEFENLQFVTTGMWVSPQSPTENATLPFIYRNLPPQTPHCTLLLGKGLTWNKLPTCPWLNLSTDNTAVEIRLFHPCPGPKYKSDLISRSPEHHQSPLKSRITTGFSTSGNEDRHTLRCLGTDLEAWQKIWPANFTFQQTASYL